MLDKAIKYGKEKRKAYRGVKAFDPWTRNGRRDSIARWQKEWKEKKENLRAEDE